MANPSGLWRCWLSEALGILLFVTFSLGAAALAQRGVLPTLIAAALVPGLITLALIYGLSDLSGAHFNPTVTLAFALRGSFPWRKVPGYLLAQLLGAIGGVLLVAALLPLPRPHEQVPPWGAFWLEAGCTMVLVLVILSTAKRKSDVGEQAGGVISGTLAFCLLTAGSVSDIGVNTARSLAAALVRGETLMSWPHVLGPLAGSALAAGLIFILRGPLNDDEQEAANGEAEGGT